MKKVQALPVLLSLLLICSVVLLPTKTLAFSVYQVKEYFNPFEKISSLFNQDQSDISLKDEPAETMIWTELPVHSEYVVKAGDTFQSIAQLYRISRVDLQDSNPWRAEPLEAGQVVYIPLSAETVYHVTWGDTVETIADRYGVNVSEIVQKNPSLDINQLHENQEIRIPIANMKKNRIEIASLASRATVNNALAWPVKGIITSTYGQRWGGFHQGIDIWNERELNSPIAAALPGTVSFAGWSNSGYGRLVIIDHGNGIQTYYAHLNRVNVKEQQRVRQGDVVGYMGNTGNSLGVHLHFELRLKEHPINPLPYLPK